MRVMWFVASACLLVAGCAEPTAPRSPPMLRGTITSREPTFIGITVADGIHIDTVPRMLVEAVPGAGPGPMCDQAVQFFITGRTFVRAPLGTPSDTSQLMVGRRVAVWAFGIRLDSCPAQTHADTVQLE